MGEHDGGHAGGLLESIGWAAFDVVVVCVLLAGAIGYAAGLWIARDRSQWPRHRSVLWFLGLATAGAGLLGPVASAAHTSFTAHMVTHLLGGMIAPLLLVLAAPVTLALRALPMPAARAMTRFLRTPGVGFVTHPVTAAVLNAGGLWALYTTELYHLMHTSPGVHAVVHAHIFLAGYVLTAALVGPDPNPHRASMQMRSAALIAFIAAHSVLAKWLYAHPPAGVEAADAQAGAQLMYYGGDIVDVILIVLVFAGWYAATRPRGRAVSS